jgi:hypothetical protein
LAPLSIVPVKDARGLRGFLRLCGTLYADDPHFIQPLELERLDALSPKKNPYFHHAKHQFWVAMRGDKPVGRISAQIDEMAQGRQGEHVGHFGMLEAANDPEVFAALFETAEHWLREQGVKKVLGPFNLSINEECGLLIEGFDTPPMLMMPHGRPYYGERVEALGYAKERDLFAYYMDITKPMRPRMVEIVSRMEKTGRVKLRQLSKKKLAAEAETIRDIFNDAWSHNWGYIPMTKEEMDYLAVGLKLLLNEDMSYVAELDGETVAFMIALPNLNEAIADLGGHLFPTGIFKLLWRLKVKDPSTVRVPLMGVRTKYQNSSVGIAMALMLIERIRVNSVKRGMTHAELSWILEDNKGMRSILGMVNSHPYKTYRVYGKTLA